MKQQLLESQWGFRPSSARLHPDFVERETRLELATLALARRCSTTELLPLSKKTAVFKVVERNVPVFLPPVQRSYFLPLVTLAAETCGCVTM